MGTPSSEYGDFHDNVTEHGCCSIIDKLPMLARGPTVDVEKNDNKKTLDRLTLYE